MAATDSRPVDLSPDFAPNPDPSPPSTIGTNSPRHTGSPSQNVDEVQRRRQQRHSKKLSINFPILLPARPGDTPTTHYTASPTAISTHPMTHGTFFPPPSSHVSNSSIPSSAIVSMPLTPPSELDAPQEVARNGGKNKGHARKESCSAEFLTLLASQERRVLELKEELSRAETELIAFKKQWALYEAGKKKKTEAKGLPGGMAELPPHGRAASITDAGTGLGLLGMEEPGNDDKSEAVREKRREMARERMMGRWTATEIGQAVNNGTKKTGQRVFSSSRHTRTLSLLTVATNTKTEQMGPLDSVPNGKASLDSARQASVEAPPTPSMPTLSRANSGFDGMSFGKTYKDLATAAGRKNLTPALSPEQFVKHGKQVVDGVRDGLWNFFEDIRQATVGEEAVTGVGSGVRRQNSTKTHGGSGNPKVKRTATGGSERSIGSKLDSQQENETSFWKEFGVDTPKSDKQKRNSTDRREKRPSLPGRWPSTKTGDDFETCCPKHNHGHQNVKHAQKRLSTQSMSPKKKSTEHHASKSSTDSQHPPSLVADLLDGEDESWDNWDSNSATDPGSPQSIRKQAAQRAKDMKSGIEEGVKEVRWHDLTN